MLTINLCLNPTTLKFFNFYHDYYTISRGSNMDTDHIKFFKRLRIFNICYTILFFLFLIVSICLFTASIFTLSGSPNNSAANTSSDNFIFFIGIILFGISIIIFGLQSGVGFYLSFINKKLSKRVWLLQVIFTLMTALSVNIYFIFLLPISIYFLLKLFEYQNYYTGGGPAQANP